MSNTVYTGKERQAAFGKGGSSGRGKLLFQVETDRKRIGLEILIRLGASALAAYLSWSNGLSPALLAVFGIFCAWPLLHMGDRMELWEGGVVYLGKLYPIGRQTQASWTGRRGFFLPITWLGLGGEQINVSFMKDAEKLFNRAYNNAIYERGE